MCGLFIIASPSSFADRAAGTDPQYDFVPEAPLARGYEMIYASEIACLLKVSGVEADQATKTSEVLIDALRIMKFEPGEFTRASLMHFLAQIRYESAGGARLTQMGNVPLSRRGYGYIQVTGIGNLKNAEACMNEHSPGLGNGVARNPEKTIGDSGDNVKAAVASLCWWQTNIINNPTHLDISNEASEDADIGISQIVTTGHLSDRPNRNMTNINLRKATFTEINENENQCRQYSI